MRVLIIIGAILTITLAILWMFPHFSGYGETWFGTVGLPTEIWFVAWGILHIILSIGLLSGTGAVKHKKFKIWCSWFMLLVVGLVIVLPTGNWGGVIVVIAGVVGIVDRVN
jgi:hypothetical protein